MKLFCNILIIILARLGQISKATVQIRELDEKGLAVAPKLRFEGDQSALKFVKKGQILNLRCEAFVQPVPVVYWTRNGEPLVGAHVPEANLLEKVRNFGIRTNQIGNTVAIHRIPCAAAEDSGIFTCVADNGHQVLKRNVELVIEAGGKPFLYSALNFCAPSSPDLKKICAFFRFYMFGQIGDPNFHQHVV